MSTQRLLVFTALIVLSFSADSWVREQISQSNTCSGDGVQQYKYTYLADCGVATTCTQASSTTFYIGRECSSNTSPESRISSAFSGKDYAGVLVYSNADCSTFENAWYFEADNVCVLDPFSSTYVGLKATVSSGSVTMTRYSDSTCTTANGAAFTVASGNVNTCQTLNGKYVKVLVNNYQTLTTGVSYVSGAEKLVGSMIMVLALAIMMILF